MVAVPLFRDRTFSPESIEAMQRAYEMTCTALQLSISADLFTEISHGIDKWLWFVEAHLQAER